MGLYYSFNYDIWGTYVPHLLLASLPPPKYHGVPHTSLTLHTPCRNRKGLLVRGQDSGFRHDDDG
jgi:hypothetical protein